MVEKKILSRRRKYFVPMPHIDVKHPIARVGPHNRHVAGSDRVFQAKRKVGRIKQIGRAHV